MYMDYYFFYPMILLGQKNRGLYINTSSNNTHMTFSMADSNFDIVNDKRVVIFRWAIYNQAYAALQNQLNVDHFYPYGSIC